MFGKKFDFSSLEKFTVVTDAGGRTIKPIGGWAPGEEIQVECVSNDGPRHLYLRKIEDSNLARDLSAQMTKALADPDEAADRKLKGDSLIVSQLCCGKVGAEYYRFRIEVVTNSLVKAFAIDEGKTLKLSRTTAEFYRIPDQLKSHHRLAFRAVINGVNEKTVDTDFFKEIIGRYAKFTAKLVKTWDLFYVVDLFDSERNNVAEQLALHLSEKSISSNASDDSSQTVVPEQECQTQNLTLSGKRTHPAFPGRKQINGQNKGEKEKPRNTRKNVIVTAASSKDRTAVGSRLRTKYAERGNRDATDDKINFDVKDDVRAESADSTLKTDQDREASPEKSLPPNFQGKESGTIGGGFGNESSGLHERTLSPNNMTAHRVDKNDPNTSRDHGREAIQLKLKRHLQRVKEQNAKSPAFTDNQRIENHEKEIYPKGAPAVTDAEHVADVKKEESKQSVMEPTSTPERKDCASGDSSLKDRERVQKNGLVVPDQIVVDNAKPKRDLEKEAFNEDADKLLKRVQEKYAMTKNSVSSESKIPQFRERVVASSGDKPLHDHKSVVIPVKEPKPRRDLEKEAFEENARKMLERAQEKNRLRSTGASNVSHRSKNRDKVFSRSPTNMVTSSPILNAPAPPLSFHRESSPSVVSSVINPNDSTQQELSSTQDDSERPKFLEHILLEPTKKYRAIVTEVTAPSRFYIRLTDSNIDLIEQIIATVARENPDELVPVTNPKATDPVVLRRRDGSFVRGKIKDGLTVILIDYGSIATAEHISDLYVMPDYLQGEQPLAIRARLEGCTQSVAAFPEDVISTFKMVVQGEDVIFNVTVLNADPKSRVHTVKLVDDDENDVKELMTGFHGSLTKPDIPPPDSLCDLNPVIADAKRHDAPKSASPMRTTDRFRDPPHYIGEQAVSPTPRPLSERKEFPSPASVKPTVERLKSPHVSEMPVHLSGRTTKDSLVSPGEPNIVGGEDKKSVSVPKGLVDSAALSKAIKDRFLNGGSKQSGPKKVAFVNMASTTNRLFVRSDNERTKLREIDLALKNERLVPINRAPRINDLVLASDNQGLSRARLIEVIDERMCEINLIDQGKSITTELTKLFQMPNNNPRVRNEPDLVQLVELNKICRKEIFHIEQLEQVATFWSGENSDYLENIVGTAADGIAIVDLCLKENDNTMARYASLLESMTVFYDKLSPLPLPTGPFSATIAQVYTDPTDEGVYGNFWIVAQCHKNDLIDLQEVLTFGYSAVDLQGGYEPEETEVCVVRTENGDYCRCLVTSTHPDNTVDLLLIDLGTALTCSSKDLFPPLPFLGQLPAVAHWCCTDDEDPDLSVALCEDALEKGSEVMMKVIDGEASPVLVTFL